MKQINGYKVQTQNPVPPPLYRKLQNYWSIQMLTKPSGMSEGQFIGWTNHTKIQCKFANRQDMGKTQSKHVLLLRSYGFE